MKKLLLFVVCLVLSICSCSNNVTEESLTLSDLEGTWVSSYGEEYTITPTTISNGGSWGTLWTGENLVLEGTPSLGYIYFQFTTAPDENYQASETAPDVGQWYCLLYKDYTGDTIDLAGASKEQGKTSMPTLEQAKAEFTLENGYFEWFSSCQTRSITAEPQKVKFTRLYK